MGRLRQLALEWNRRADEDAAVARRHGLMRDEFQVIAHTRRNCAWELLRVLNELEKESPADGGGGGP